VGKPGARAAAAAAGNMVYDGKPCRGCGTTLKYTTKSGCVSCNRTAYLKRGKAARPDQIARLIARAEPCSICSTTRRLKNGECAACAGRRRKKYNLTDRARFYARDRHYRLNYGLTIAQRDTLLVAQGGVCAICGTDQPDRGGWHVDHDHGTDEVRGVLCRACNNGIGDMRDSVEILERAIRYLTERELRQARLWLVREGAWAVANLDLGDRDADV
jgi:hypothetical protein